MSNRVIPEWELGMPILDSTIRPLTQYKFAICVERVENKGRVAKANVQTEQDRAKIQKLYIEIYKQELKDKEVKIKLYKFVKGSGWEEEK